MTTRPLRERDIEAYLVQRVKSMGGDVRKVKWIGRNGAPDRLVLLYPRVDRVPDTPHGRFIARAPVQIWVELKAPGKTVEPHQLREHDRLAGFGCAVRVVDSLRGVDDLLA